MRKQVKVIRYVGVLFLTIMIFGIGIFLGTTVEGLRVDSLYTQLQVQDLDYQTVLTESNYLDYLVSQKESGENVSCQIMKGAYYTSISTLDNSRIKLENYIDTGSVKEEEFARLKDHYANLQINYWMLANRISQQCGKSEMNIILYFYTDDKLCPECQDQGVHLTYVKQKLKDKVLIFSLDYQRPGTINLLAQNYDVLSKGAPTLIINGESYGFLTNSQIFQILNVSQ